ncbi:SRPBCC family protein [Pelagovum pacificum]|uniref:SRPBCC family protein n=1 Tax=Pelagovum pacificum TaxID=2588711 RepID=A0A5C5GD33_9RHOB|nr:SRPBCC family protein [Pelagovum pacificum]QQA44830.1 SRPBCC family protein [Pelagovum pacificum]TNY32064.1 SRPBCC family protein [Pelagovum pacificum]
MDFQKHLGAVDRTVTELERDGAPARAVSLTRIYPTDPSDLWDALTSKDRLPRWFAPVDGDFRPGGRFKITGNAEGEILECEEPRLLSLTWEFGGGISWVDVTLSPEGDATRLTLVHTAPVTPHWAQFGPGAVGVGWDLGLLGLALHVADPDAEKPDETSFHTLPEGRAFIIGSGEDWIRADAAGGATTEEAEARGRATIAFYTGEPLPES